MTSNQQRRPDSLLSAVFPILVVFLFAVYTGFIEFTPGLREIRPLLVIGGLGLIAVGVTGRIGMVLSSPIGKAITAFTIWFIICIPLAIWRGGSIVVFKDYWSKSFLAFVLMAGLISTAAESKKIFHTIAYGVGFLAILALAMHSYTVDGRLGLPGGRYENSNDLAWTLLVGLIFLAYLYMQSNGSGRLWPCALPLLCCWPCKDRLASAYVRRRCALPLRLFSSRREPTGSNCSLSRACLDW